MAPCGTQGSTYPAPWRRDRAELQWHKQSLCALSRMKLGALKTCQAATMYKVLSGQVHIAPPQSTLTYITWTSPHPKAPSHTSRDQLQVSRCSFWCSAPFVTWDLHPPFPPPSIYNPPHQRLGNGSFTVPELALHVCKCVCVFVADSLFLMVCLCVNVSVHLWPTPFVFYVVPVCKCVCVFVTDSVCFVWCACV